MRASAIVTALLIHVTILLAALGVRLGEGVLRRPAGKMARIVSGPLLLAVLSLLAEAVLLPMLLPEAESQRSFHRSCSTRQRSMMVDATHSRAFLFVHS